MYGSLDASEVSFIGRTNYVAALEEKKFIFGIKRVDRKRHLYVIGKSGVGKTKLQELLIRQDIAYGHGACIIAPHGELISDILHFIPQNRIDDVCVVDPSDTAFPVSFNPLVNVDPAFKHQMTQGLIEVLRKQFGNDWSSRLEHLFRYTTLALLDYPEATMRGMISMLTDRSYRAKVVEHIEDEMVKRFWAMEFADWSEKFAADAVIPLVNKLGQFLSDPMLRNIFGQKENKVDIERLMNEKKIILVNLAKDKIGEENSSFFGCVFLTKIKQAGMARAQVSSKERADYYLYIDEFQNVVTDTFENILSEARKYGINMTLAHQYVEQLPSKTQHSVIGNVGSMICFRVGGEDAQTLKPEFAPVFDSKDMINLGVGEFYIKMTIDGESYDPFSAETLKVLPAPYPSSKEAVLAASRKTYAITLEEHRQMLQHESESV